MKQGDFNGKIKAKIKAAWAWLKINVFVRDMIVWVIIAELIFWSPCIVGAVLAIVVNKWWWSVCVAYWAFWAAPFTPATPIQLALALALKKLFGRKPPKNKDGAAKQDKQDEQDENGQKS